MTSTADHETIVQTFTAALARLNRVTDYLRENHETDVSNQIAKNVNEIAAQFTDAAIRLGDGTGKTKSYPEYNDPFTAGVGANNNGPWALYKIPEEAPQPKTENKIPPGNTPRLVAREHTRESSTESQSRNQNSVLSSWARIAAKPPPRDNEVVIKTKPTKTQASDLSASHNRHPPESLDEQTRVIWVMGCTKETPLSFITDQITEGPLLSVAFSEPDRAFCIIFQHGSSASAFLETNAHMLRTSGQCCYGPEYELAVGAPFPINDELKAMEAHRRERRRLTFVKSGLFQDMAKARFQRDVRDAAGDGNIERIFIFNSGNATVVFASTTVARLVREKFLQKATCAGGIYEELSVSFSSDPCEKPVNWIAQHQHTGNYSSGKNTQKSPSPNGNDNDISPGWEKVKHRRR